MRKISMILALLLSLVAISAAAVDAVKIDQDAHEALNRLYKNSSSTKDVIARAAGVLIFPSIYKAGVGVGGEYGQGVLIEHGKTIGYYNIVSGSVGFQLGAQKFSQIIAFMDTEALRKFKNSEGWKAGVDGSIVLIESGKSGDFDTAMLNNPILGFVLGEKGLMYNITLEGSKITKIHK